MCCKMCAIVALYLVFLVAFSEGFFMPASFRKQPDCVRRAPQTTTYNNQQWVPTATSGNNGVNTIQGGYNNPKDFNGYPQQQQQQQQVQHLQHQQQLIYSQPLQNPQATAPKYEATPFQTINQPQYAYEGVYPAPLNSYPQSVQLVPCLCPVNKEMIEQQQQQQHYQQQTPQSVTPTSSSFTADTSNNAAPPPQTNQKKTS